MTTVRDLIGRQERVVFVDPGVTVREAAKAMGQVNVGCTAILKDGKLVGMFTERDVLKRVMLKDLDVDQVKVEEVMTRQVVSCRPETDVRLARLLLRDHHIRHLPVVEEDGRLLGVLSIRDLVDEELHELRKYLHLEEG
ncbi:MAG: CBS domain-containing protein [Planctomycetes bacterium]|nr:CBS domain-containing protein [Planctomycetota bacterium]